MSTPNKKNRGGVFDLLDTSVIVDEVPNNMGKSMNNVKKFFVLLDAMRDGEIRYIETGDIDRANRLVQSGIYLRKNKVIDIEFMLWRRTKVNKGIPSIGVYIQRIKKIEH